MSTFAELKAENEKLWGDLRNLTKESERFEGSLNSLLTKEELTKIFKPFEVTIETTSAWRNEKTAKLKVSDNDESLPILRWRDSSGISLDRAWKEEDTEIFEILLQRDFYNVPKTYEEATKRLENINNLEKEIKSLFVKFDSMAHYDEYVENLKVIEDTKDKITKNYNEAKIAFILEKYGELGTIVVGKSYFLYDTNMKSKIAFVEVLEKEESGLGYKCVDHEADNKKYSHVRERRLEVDLRDFPESELRFGIKK